MRDLTTILRTFIGRSFPTQVAFAEKVGANQTDVSLVVNGKRPLSMKSIDAWADALGLSAQERKDFRLAVAIANSPDEVVQRLVELEHEVGEMRKLAQLIREREIKRRGIRRHR